ncbi:unnamed protein product [Clonostachys rhizophaga]|uniref:EKC/KEOPS complex subunit BUD32 n=1 Tax=Clonostachys rhizophaga TaxID=160324 RepID=A0A9N9YTY8_9HYPO|nr:unnamed protein product [Clonostachys rhizophaga]
MSGLASVIVADQADYALTEQQVRIISEHPFKNSLDYFHARIKLSERDFHESDTPRQDDVAGLLGALVASPAAFSLPSPDGNGNAAFKLLSLLQRVRESTIELDRFRPLIRCIVNKSPDNTIWAAFGIPLVHLLRLIPASIRLSKEHRELFEEIRTCTFRNVGGFCDRFFDSKSWGKQQQDMLKGVMAEHNGTKWKGFPSTPDGKLVWDWLRSLEERAFPDAPHKLHTTTTANQFKQRKGQMDIFFQVPAAKAGAFEYKHILVVGEQKKSYDKGRFKADLLQLTRYVRGVFADQPTCRFVLGFTLCASTMELWVFDRSGPYSSGPFDIHANPEKFACAIIGYATMDDDAMGLDTFIQREDRHRHVTLDDADGNQTRIRLGRPMVRQKAVVCRGTTCFETRNNHVAKFSWASDKRQLEVKQLMLAEQRGVQGVARVVAHRRIGTIAELCKGLDFQQRHRFRNEDAHLDSPTILSGTSASKRKSSSNHTSDSVSGSKRLRSGNQKLSGQLLTGNGPSLYTPSEDLWENRIYSCLVISPAGRVVSEFTTVRELLESLRDAIKAHQSLYTKGNILHRDISTNNIIITKAEASGGFKGMLIDLDLAKERGSGPSGARHQTGTMQFMAVEVLRKTDHTYRHDLESFFYVLVWLCARHSWNNGFDCGSKPPKESLLRKWEIGSFNDIADAKEGHMTVNSLKRIMGEFAAILDILKPLCLTIRKILFPLDKDEEMSFGTPVGDPDQLYGPIVAAFDDTIESLSKH